MSDTQSNGTPNQDGTPIRDVFARYERTYAPLRECVTGCPAIGDGNPSAAFLLQIVLESGPFDTTDFCLLDGNPIIDFARSRAGDATSSTINLEKQTNGNGRTRSGRLARLILVPLMRRMLEERFDEPPTFVFGTQEFYLEAAINAFSSGDTKFALFISDVRNKVTALDTINQAIKNGIKIHIFVWNNEAKELLEKELRVKNDSKKANAVIHVVEHPMVRQLRERLSNNCQHQAEGFYFKPSGLGIPVEIIEPILQSLAQQSGTVVLSRNMDEYKPKEDDNHDIVRTETPREVVHAHLKNFLNREVIFAMPSEMIALYSSLIVAINDFNQDPSNTKIRIPTFVCLPPKGEHEVENLKWAIEHGLVKYIILPEEYEIDDGEIRKLINNEKLQVVRPGKVGQRFQEFSSYTTKPKGKINGETDITAVVTNILEERSSEVQA